MVIGFIVAAATIGGTYASVKGAKANARYQEQVARNNAKRAERQAEEERINAQIELENTRRILEDIKYVNQIQGERRRDFIDSAYEQIAQNEVRRSGSGLSIRSRTFDLQRIRNRTRVSEGVGRIERDRVRAVDNVIAVARNHELKARAHQRRAQALEEDQVFLESSAASISTIGQYQTLGAVAQGVVGLTSILGDLSTNPYKNSQSLRY